MKIAHFQDLNPFEHDGGAQLNDRGMIIKGFRLNHNIEIITPQNIGLKSFEGTDLIIFSNIMSFPRNTIKSICDKYPYVFHHKDFNFYPLRLFYPQKPIGEVNYYRDFWLPIYMNAKAHIFLSPLHREAFLIAYPELKKFKPIYIPSCIDIDLWKEIKGIERKPNTVVGINSLAPFKGRYKIFEYVKKHPKLHFTFIGNTSPLDPTLTNVNYITYVANAELPKILNQFEYFIHLPDHTDPFNRTITEALLCGCKIIGNENIGCLSYDWNFSDRENVRRYLKQASVGFWEEISLIVKEMEGSKNEQPATNECNA